MKALRSPYLGPVVTAVILFITGAFAAEYFGLYERFPHMDKLLHFVGGFAVASFFQVFFYQETKKASFIRRSILLLAMAALVGTLWEMLEYTVNTLQYSHPTLYDLLHGGDLADTLADLYLDIFGAITFVLVKRK